MKTVYACLCQRLACLSFTKIHTEGWHLSVLSSLTLKIPFFSFQVTCLYYGHSVSCVNVHMCGNAKSLKPLHVAAVPVSGTCQDQRWLVLRSHGSTKPNKGPAAPLWYAHPSSLRPSHSLCSCQPSWPSASLQDSSCIHTYHWPGP